MKHARAAAVAVLLTTLWTGTARAQALVPGEREAAVTAIPGIVAAGAKWEIVWADFETADGINGTPDGGVIFAQEQTDTIRKLAADGKEYTVVSPTRGVGSVSLDAQGRLYAVERTCTEPLNTFLPGCNDMTAVVQLLPERRVLAMTFANGAPLGRLNDLIADGKGGAYFTVGGAFYVNPAGVVSVVADQDIRSNGIMLSPDARTLYVTNNTSVLAFDVKADGTTANRRALSSLSSNPPSTPLILSAAAATSSHSRVTSLTSSGSSGSAVTSETRTGFTSLSLTTRTRCTSMRRSCRLRPASCSSTRNAFPRCRRSFAGGMFSTRPSPSFLTSTRST